MHQITFLKLDNIPILWKHDHTYHDTILTNDFSMNQPGMEMVKTREDQSGAGEAQSHAHSHTISHTPPYQADQADKQKKGKIKISDDFR